MALDSSFDELTSVVVRVRELLLSEQDAQAAVSKLALAADHLIESALGAGVSLLDDKGHRLSTATTDTMAEAADAVQYRLGEGRASRPGPNKKLNRSTTPWTILGGPVGRPLRRNWASGPCSAFR